MKRAQIYETGTNLFENASMGDENAKSTQQNNTYQLIERQNLQERLSMTKKNSNRTCNARYSNVVLTR